ncbi:MAG: hypothetical protein ABH848_02500 [Candidatus Omnitrophota bacterium]
MNKIILLLFLLVFFSPDISFSEEIDINSEIISIDAEGAFFIIDVGENKNIEVGDGAIIHRNGDKIGEAYVIEARPAVSALEIISIVENREIEQGDQILIVKEVAGVKRAIEPIKTKERSKWAKITPASDSTKKTTKSKWSILLGSNAPSSSGESITTSSGFPVTSSPASLKTTDYITQSMLQSKSDVIGLDIKRDPKVVFSYARLILRENGYIIESSNRGSGMILATKPIQVSILKELWADLRSVIEHNFVVSIEIAKEGDSSKIIASSFLEHTQKQKHIKRAVSKGSSHYKDLVNVLSEIKNRSEY